MATYKTPGVFVEEISILPASVGQVSSAIPVFIGYTDSNNLVGVPTRVGTFLEYINLFGNAFKENITIEVDAVTDLPIAATLTAGPSNYKLYYSVQLYFANGGGPCYIISVGNYSSTFSAATIASGLLPLEKEEDPTLIVFPDLTSSILSTSACYNVYKDALAHCEKVKNRFVIIDLREGSDTEGGYHVTFRTQIGNQNLKYGAAYFPWVETTLKYNYDAASSVVLSHTGSLNGLNLNDPVLSSQFVSESIELISGLKMKLPPGGAIAGTYVQSDRVNGVWKAPANIELNAITKPAKKITDALQVDMNVHSSGKSINAIRAFEGKGNVVWGARTLAGNDNEWRYINVRRLFITAEESIKRASGLLIFEPNVSATWIRAKALIENYLTGLWRQGALAGATKEAAFFVSVGLGETMSDQDILEGRMVIEIGMAVVRPAEFIILRFSHLLQQP